MGGMKHSCDYCNGKRGAWIMARQAIFQHLREDPNTTSKELARAYPVTRNAVVKWRKQGESRGCIPPRTESGHTRANKTRGRRTERPRVEPTPVLLQRPALPASRGPAWPIGTLCTTEATARLA